MSGGARDSDIGWGSLSEQVCLTLKQEVGILKVLTGAL
jgi:hypothetical protein